MQRLAVAPAKANNRALGLQTYPVESTLKSAWSPFYLNNLVFTGLKTYSPPVGLHIRSSSQPVEAPMLVVHHAWAMWGVQGL